MLSGALKRPRTCITTFGLILPPRISTTASFYLEILVRCDEEHSSYARMVLCLYKVQMEANAPHHVELCAQAARVAQFHGHYDWCASGVYSVRCKGAASIIYWGVPLTRWYHMTMMCRHVIRSSTRAPCLSRFLSLCVFGAAEKSGRRPLAGRSGRCWTRRRST